MDDGTVDGSVGSKKRRRGEGGNKSHKKVKGEMEEAVFGIFGDGGGAFHPVPDDDYDFTFASADGVTVQGEEDEGPIFAGLPGVGSLVAGGVVGGVPSGNAYAGAPVFYGGGMGSTAGAARGGGGSRRGRGGGGGGAKRSGGGGGGGGRKGGGGGRGGGAGGDPTQAALLARIEALERQLQQGGGGGDAASVGGGSTAGLKQEAPAQQPSGPFPAGFDETQPVTYDEKKNLRLSIERLPADKVAKVLKIIEVRCSTLEGVGVWCVWGGRVCWGVGEVRGCM